MRWLSPLLAHAGAHDDVLVVCRTQATLRAVLRAFDAEARSGGRRGWLGLQVATLGGLLAESAPPVLGRVAAAVAAAGVDALPSSHPWAATLADRPRLRAELRDRVEQVDVARALDVPLDGLSPELASLAGTGFGRPGPAIAARRLVSRARGHVVAVGFGDGLASDCSFAGTLGHAERVLLSRLGASVLTSTRGPDREARLGDRALRVHRVLDVTAEARAVARLLAGRARVDDAVVLVPDSATAGRVRAALARNGIAVADDAPVPLRSHALAAAIAVLVPLFATNGEAPLTADDLLRLLTSPVLSTRMPRFGDAGADDDVPDAAEPAEDEADGEVDEGAAAMPESPAAVRPARLRARHAHELVAETRILRAPLARWVARVRQLEARLQSQGDEGSRVRRESAAVLRVRLERMAHAANRGTLHALATCLSEVGLWGDDPVGRAMLASLKVAGAVPATEDAVREVLDRSVSRRAVHEGAQILEYREYDGRDASLVVLTGVHDKGLARVPPPDPLLREQDARVLGVASGLAAQQERLALARWAVARAGEAVALFAEHDASGRRVAFPVDLAGEVFFDEASLGGAYGRDLPRADGAVGAAIPELDDLRAFGEGGEADPLAAQLDAEWARTGAGFTDAPAPPVETPRAVPGKGDPLSAYLEAVPARPSHVLPLLGRVGKHPAGEDGLPDGFTLSASELGHFALCLYRAFCVTGLRLRSRDEVEEEASARDVGTKAHAALEHALAGRSFVVPNAVYEAERAAMLEGLRRGTRAAFAELAVELDLGPGDPVRTALDAQAERWCAHWGRWLDARLTRVSTVVGDARREAVGGAAKWPEYAALWSALEGQCAKDARTKGLGAAVDAALAGASLLADPALLVNQVAKGKQAGVAAWLASPAAEGPVGALRERVERERESLAAPTGADARVAHVELAFEKGQTLDLEAFYRDHFEESTYQRSMFPGLIDHPLHAPVVLLCFTSAKIVITGGKSVDQIHDGWAQLAPVVTRYLVSK